MENIDGNLEEGISQPNGGGDFQFADYCQHNPGGRQRPEDPVGNGFNDAAAGRFHSLLTLPVILPVSVKNKYHFIIQIVNNKNK
jgi:hypothetical protein